MFNLSNILSKTPFNLSDGEKKKLLDTGAQVREQAENLTAKVQANLPELEGQLDGLQSGAMQMVADFKGSPEVTNLLGQLEGQGKDILKAVKLEALPAAETFGKELLNSGLVSELSDGISNLTRNNSIPFFLNRDDFDEGEEIETKIPKADDKSKVAEKKTKKNRYVKNPLEVFTSVNYQLSMGVLSNEELADPDNTYLKNKGPQVMILKSGGGTRTLGDRKALTAFERQDSGGRVEYFMEDLEIDAVISPNPKVRTASLNKFSFKIIEPYSMGQFLETLHIASLQAGHANYIGAPMLIMIDWVGYDDKGNVKRLSSMEGQDKRYLPIMLSNADFKVTQSGSEYNMQGISYNDSMLTDEVQKIPTDITVKGGTLNELLQTSSTSLTAQLNTTLLKRESKDELAYADEYVVLFPKDRASASNVVNDNVETTATQEGVHRSLTEARKKYNLDPSSGTNIAALKKAISLNTFDYETWTKKILGVSIRRGNQSETLKDKAAQPVNTNAIGSSSIIFTVLQKGQPGNPTDGFTYNSDKDVYETSSAFIPKGTNDITFKEGTKINKIIEELVMCSSYGRGLKDKKVNDRGEREWFKIEHQVFNVPVYEIEIKKGRFPRLYVFRVVPYYEPAASWVSPTDVAKGVTKIRDTTVKEYNYLYTGKNKDVIDFDIKFEYRFLTRVTPDKGGNTADLNNEGSHATLFELDAIRLAQGQVAGKQELPKEKIWKKSGVKALVNYSGGMRGIASGEADEIARQFHDATVNHPVDLIHASLTIWGDPYFISDSGMGNYNSKGAYSKMIDERGQMTYQDKKVYIDLHFRTPFDYNQDGTMAFPLYSNGTAEEGTKLAHFSGLYWVKEVVSQFNQGKFQQELKLIRLPNQQGDANAFPQLPTKEILTKTNTSGSYTHHLNTHKGNHFGGGNDDNFDFEF